MSSLGFGTLVNQTFKHLFFTINASNQFSKTLSFTGKKNALLQILSVDSFSNVIFHLQNLFEEKC